ncbi:MAG: hypothetical protein VXV96_12890 [Bdellovibrionota bacterium]|nr:hypothetical protein [Bdellovibrionota bacterium]
MELSIAYVKNESQVLYQQYSEDSVGKPQIFELEDLDSKDLHGIILPKELLESDELKEKLSKTQRYAPIKTIASEQMSVDQFDSLGKEEALELTKNIYTSWTIRNNLNLVENMFANLEHLKGLFPNDRTAFFEELWHTLRSNLGATTLTLAYNHLKKAEKENEKNQLIRVVVEGTSKPNPSENKELGEALFKNYEGKFAKPFEVYSWNRETGQAVFLVMVKESPAIIMANLFDLTPLQRAALNCLFEGLQ